MSACLRPKTYGLAQHRCRKCEPCLQHRLRTWLLRMLLEAQQYSQDEVTFLTLTYAPEHLPTSPGESKRTLQLWLKRLRKLLSKHGLDSIRYVAALEEGKQATQRYHWHIVLYGLKFTQLNRLVLHQQWGQGFIDWKPCVPAQMSYLLKYVIKGGVFLMSRQPGIGAGMVPALQQILLSLSSGEISKLRGPVSSVFRPGQNYSVNRIQVGGYDYPLHRYLRERLLIPKLPEHVEAARQIFDVYRSLYGQEEK